jgi:hypothetical protein
MAGLFMIGFNNQALWSLITKGFYLSVKGKTTCYPQQNK